MNVEPIGFVETCFKQKLGIPRQSNLVPSAFGTLKLNPVTNWQQALQGIEHYSHLWVIFSFHALKGSHLRPKVRMPRLGGDKKIGVYASRSPFRLNPLGMSVVKIERIDFSGEGAQIEFSGGDLLDGTPVFDVKPYLPYSDMVPEAKCTLPEAAFGAALEVEFSQQVAERLSLLSEKNSLKQLITETLRLDPRPTSQRNGPNQQKEWKTNLNGFDVVFVFDGDRVLVKELNTNPINKENVRSMNKDWKP